MRCLLALPAVDTSPIIFKIRCAGHAGGSICAVLEYRAEQEKARDNSFVDENATSRKTGLAFRAPRMDPEEVRLMHEWWCGAEENRSDGICLSLDVDHMHEW